MCIAQRNNASSSLVNSTRKGYPWLTQQGKVILCQSNKLNKVHAQRYALIMINRDGLFENHTVVRHYFGYNFFLLRKFAIRSKHLYSNQDIALRMHNSTSKSDRPFYTGGVGGPSKPWAGTPNISKL